MLLKNAIARHNTRQSSPEGTQNLFQQYRSNAEATRLPGRPRKAPERSRGEGVSWSDQARTPSGNLRM